LNLGSSINHTINGLVDDNRGMRLLHYFVNLVAFGTDKQGHHTFWDENDDGERLFFYFFKFLIDVCQKKLTALKLLLHLFVIYLSKIVGT
jgi:hypothetical protein